MGEGLRQHLATAGHRLRRRSLTLTLRLPVGSLRVLVDEDAAGSGSGVVVDGAPHPARPPVAGRSGRGNLEPFPHERPFPLRGVLPTSESVRGLYRPPGGGYPPTVSPASAVPLDRIPEGGVEAAVVGRVIDGQARRAVLGIAAAARGICGWWAPLGAYSAHMGPTVHDCSGGDRRPPVRRRLIAGVVARGDLVHSLVDARPAGDPPPARRGPAERVTSGPSVLC